MMSLALCAFSLHLIYPFQPACGFRQMLLSLQPQPPAWSEAPG